ncbi:cupin domain protein [Aerococcus viridans ATCC 11563 = CCUG 4311]|uniref:Cupin domain protein n=3 Tax=Aerococcus TaxID=1375 RepID=A0ABN0A7R4_AERVM|nr:cupin domain protein [Aerococcus viridans ATCC 11563 = CCUG 4311]
MMTDNKFLTGNVDNDKKPYIIDVEKETLENTNFRTTIWTGNKLQLTVMEIPVGGDIGLEVHNESDQFIRIEQGEGLCQMGPAEDDLSFEQKIGEDEAVFVPLGLWHNITNRGSVPLKLYTIYASPDHVPGTVHGTQEDAESDPNE